MPYTFVKGQVLVDLVAEFTEPPMEELEPTENTNGKLVGIISQHGILPWEVYVDGGIKSEGFRDRTSTNIP